MFKKGLVSRDDTTKTHIYKPAISKDSTQKQFLNKLINTLFSGSSTQLVLQALGNQKASKTELEEIKNTWINLKKNSYRGLYFIYTKLCKQKRKKVSKKEKFIAVILQDK